ncbi:MAG: hypothetical protein Kow0025_24370 [Thermodesulfovibrionales bacterium]
MKTRLWIKVSSVVLAVALWAFVISRGQSEVVMEAPVVYENVPPGLTVVKTESTRSAAVGVRGHERFLKNLREGDVLVAVDLANAPRGRHFYSIGSGDVDLPAPLAVINVNPSAVVVTLEEVETKTVPVRAAITGLPARGYYVKAMEIEPAEARIEGAKSELAAVRSLRTEPVDISGARETVTRRVMIDPSGLDARPDVDAVNVTVIIAEERR